MSIQHFAFYILHSAFNLESAFAAQHLAPIQIAPLQAHDGHFGGSQVGGDGHIVLVAVADGFDHLGIVPGIGGIGIGEQQHQIDFVVCNAGVDLLMAALLMGKQQCDGQTRVVSDQPAGGGGGKEIMLDQNAFVGGAELNHQFLFLVVRQKCDVHNAHSFIYSGLTGDRWLPADPGFVWRCAGRPWQPGTGASF